MSPGGPPASQEVQVPSSGRWALLARREAGSLRGVWRPAHEAIQSVLCRPQFVTWIIILTSEAMPFLLLFCGGSCMDAAEGKQMTQKYEDMLSLLEK